MVIAKILRLLQLHRPELRIRRIVAMHIDYGNRPESAQEASYVRRWCEGDSEGKIEKEGENGKQGRGVGAVEGGEVEVSASNSKSTSNSNTNTTSTDSSARSAMLGGLQCRVRRVEEVTRGVTNRDEYEKISRDIRYGFYRTCIQEQQDGHAEEGLQSSSLLLSGVIFGHHLGDVQENVISNVMRYVTLIRYLYL